MAAADLIESLHLVEPTSYSTRGYPHEEWATLRKSAPVERFEPEGWPPFWAITRHADIVEISKSPQSFLNSDGINFEPVDTILRDDAQVQMRTIIEMDNPDHRKYRGVASRFFTPRSLGKWDPMIEALAVKLVDSLGEEGEADWVQDVASLHPLSIIHYCLTAVGCRAWRRPGADPLRRVRRELRRGVLGGHAPEPAS